MTRTIRALFVSPVGGSGGSERALVDLVSEVRRHSIDPVVAAPDGGWLGSALERRDIEHVVIPHALTVARRNDPARSAWRMVARARAARRIATIGGGVDVVVTNTVATDVGGRGSKALGVPHVWYVREHVATLVPDARLRERVLEGIDAADAVIAVSRHARDGLRCQRSDGGATVVHDGIAATGTTIPERPAPDRNAPRLLFVGTLDPIKGGDLAIDVLADVRRRHAIGAHLEIVGPGGVDALASLRAKARLAGVLDAVTFSGCLDHDDLTFRYRGADVVLVTSRSEGFGRIPLEAAQHGIPFVSTRVGAAPEIAATGAGTCVSDEDVAGLSDAVADMVGNGWTAARSSTEQVLSEFNNHRTGVKVSEVLHKVVIRHG